MLSDTSSRISTFPNCGELGYSLLVKLIITVTELWSVEYGIPCDGLSDPTEKVDPVEI